MVRGIVYDTRKQLKPGRRECMCQARVHDLVRNCLNCGRIVCQQEGSGPCFNCGNLVCTRDEQKILKAGDKSSYNLLKKFESSDFALPGSIKFDDISKSILKHERNGSNRLAEEYKDKLLAADKNCSATKVNDLEADYYSLEHNAFISPEDRDIIIKRKEELKLMAMEAKRKIVLSLDITNKAISEEKQSKIETINDPVIQSILSRAISQHNAENNSTDLNLSDSERPAHKFLLNFTPQYVESDDSANTPNVKTNLSIPLKAERGITWCIALPPKLASDLANGIRSHIPWKNEFRTRGLILIAASKRNQKSEILNEEIDSSSADYPESAIVGRAIVTECLTWEEYKIEYPQGECYNVNSGFIILFEMQETLASPFVFGVLSELFPIDKGTAELVRRNLLRDDVLTRELIPLDYL